METCTSSSSFRKRVFPLGRLVHDELSWVIIDPAATPCHYCGQPASGKDHQFPQSMRRMLADDPIGYAALAAPFTQDTVPSCRECNSLLGAKYDRSPEARFQRLKERLAKRYRKLLSMPEWPIHLLRELQGNLLLAVEGALVEREAVLARIAWHSPAR